MSSFIDPYVACHQPAAKRSICYILRQMLHCTTACDAYISEQGVRDVSKQLYISAAISTFVMVAMVLFATPDMRDGAQRQAYDRASLAALVASPPTR